MSGKDDPDGEVVDAFLMALDTTVSSDRKCLSQMVGTGP